MREIIQYKYPVNECNFTLCFIKNCGLLKILRRVDENIRKQL